MSEWREYFRKLLINRRVMLHLAIWLDNEKDSIHICELPDLSDTDSYPDIFRLNDIDKDGTRIRMSGMFGNAVYTRVNGEWTETEYHQRDNSLTSAHALSWILTHQ